jgi:molybdopterin converting factor small subunit
MKIRLRLLATLRKYLPADATRLAEDTVELEVPEGTSPTAVIARLGLAKGEWALVMVDGRHQRYEELNGALVDGQSLTIAPPVAGG